MEFPNVTTQPPSVDYIQNTWAPEQRISVSLSYDAASDSMIRLGEAESQANVPKDRDRHIRIKKAIASFQNTVTAYLQKKGDTKGFQLSTFDDVVLVMQEIETGYLSTDTWQGRARDVFRKISRRSDAVMPALELLPDGPYKTLCGGLKLVVNSMKKHTAILDQISRMLEELPDEQEDIEDYLVIYQEPYYRPRLQARMEDMFIAMMAVLEEIVKWLTQPTYS